MKRFIAATATSVLFFVTAHASASAIDKDHLWSPPVSGPPIDTQVEGWGENSGQTLPFSFSPFDEDNSEFVQEIARNSFNTVLANCNSSNDIGCIESIKFSIDGETWEDAVFKQTLQQRDFAYGVPTDDGWGMQYTSTWKPDADIGLLEASLPNEYELAGASHGMGDDYTINVTAISAIEDGFAKIQGLKFEAIAGGVNEQDGDDCDYWGISNEIVDDDRISYCYEPVDLPEDLQLEVNVQLGDRINELSGWFDGRIYDPTIIFGTPESPGLISVKGSPMKVNYFETLPIPKGHELFNVPDDLNQMQKEGGVGTRGMWRPRTGLDEFLRLESFVPEASAEVDSVWKMESWSRDLMIDQCSSNTGVQGIIITNATTYSPNPPIYSSDSGNLEFQVASTRYLPDGVTLNKGYYKLILQETLADCLWGEGNATSASISVVEDSGEANSSVNNIQVVDGWVSFTAADFHFSAPRIFVGFNEEVMEPEASATPTKSTAIKPGLPTETPSSTPEATPTPTPIPSPTQSAVAVPQMEDTKTISTNLLIGIALAIWIAIAGAVAVMRRTK